MATGSDIQIFKLRDKEFLLNQDSGEITSQGMKTVTSIDVGIDGNIDLVWVKEPSDYSYLYIKGTPANNMVGRSASEILAKLKQIYSITAVRIPDNFQIPKNIYFENGARIDISDHGEGKVREERIGNIQVEPGDNFTSATFTCSPELPREPICTDASERFSIEYYLPEKTPQKNMISSNIERWQKYFSYGQALISEAYQKSLTAKNVIKSSDDLEDKGTCAKMPHVVGEPKKDFYCFEAKTNRTNVCFEKSTEEYLKIKDCAD